MAGRPVPHGGRGGLRVDLAAGSRRAGAARPEGWAARARPSNAANDAREPQGRLMPRDVRSLGRKRRGPRAGQAALLLAFSFAIMADPVSSVAYAIEAAL